MNERSVWWWMAYLGRHKGYIWYCSAKRDGNEERCRQLEAKFELVADLYADLGDIFAANILREKVAFRRWLLQRRPLFREQRPVVHVSDPATYVPRPATLLLEVPLYARKSDAVSGVQGFLDRYYGWTLLEEAKGHRKPRLELDEHHPPKYQLFSGASDLNAATIKALRKAIYVDKLRRAKTVDGKLPSLTDMVQAIKEDPKNPFGWSLTEQDKRDIAKGVYKKGLFGGSEVTLVKRAQRDFEAFVRNTIHGRFPDNS